MVRRSALKFCNITVPYSGICIATDLVWDAVNSFDPNTTEEKGEFGVKPLYIWACKDRKLSTDHTIISFIMINQRTGELIKHSFLIMEKILLVGPNTRFEANPHMQLSRSRKQETTIFGYMNLHHFYFVSCAFDFIQTTWFERCVGFGFKEIRREIIATAETRIGKDRTSRQWLQHAIILFDRLCRVYRSCPTKEDAVAAFYKCLSISFFVVEEETFEEKDMSGLMPTTTPNKRLPGWVMREFAINEQDFRSQIFETCKLIDFTIGENVPETFVCFYKELSAKFHEVISHNPFIWELFGENMQNKTRQFLQTPDEEFMHVLTTDETCGFSLNRASLI